MAQPGGLNMAALPSDGATIKFPCVNFNHGWRYNPSTSHFMCPDSNAYFFSATLYSAHDRWAGFYIVMNGVIKSHGATGHAKGASSGTAIALIDCQPGQQVWVRIRSKSHTSVSVFASKSRFSGFRIW